MLSLETLVRVGGERHHEEHSHECCDEGQEYSVLSTEYSVLEAGVASR